MKINACIKHELDNETLLEQLAMDDWTIDGWGHAKKEFDGVKYRMKFMSRHIRYEMDSDYGWLLMEIIKYD